MLITTTYFIINNAPSVVMDTGINMCRIVITTIATIVVVTTTTITIIAIDIIIIVIISIRLLLLLLTAILH